MRNLGNSAKAGKDTVSCIHWAAWPKVRVACGAIVGALILFSPAAHSQSFLEKLESAVRKQIDDKAPPTVQPQPSTPGEELPPPNQDVGRTKPNKDIPIVPSPPKPGNSGQGLPSILDSSNKVPNPLELSPGTAKDQAPVEPPVGAGVYLGLEVEELVGGGIGVRVAELTNNSPAWKAGFKIGDRILAIDGHAIANIEGMAERMRRVQPGSPTKFLINRGGRNSELTAVLQDAALAARIHGTPGLPQLSVPAWIGASVHDVSPAFREQFGLSIFSGAAVTNIVPGSPAQLAGIRPGDAIVEVDGVPIVSGDDLMSWVKSAKVGQSAELMVYRGIQRLYVTVVVSSDPRGDSTPDRRLPNSSTASRSPLPSPLQGRSNASLQAEVNELRERLELTQRQLEQTQQQLNQLLQRIEPK